MEAFETTEVKGKKSVEDYEEIIVSIWCITYNHEKYIRDAIEGFLNQKVDFKYEIVIHDDASTDATPHILKEYELKYPELIHVIYETENQYSKPHWQELINKIQRTHLRGKYVAFCEGDDYWTDSSKLQTQVDYMDEYRECVLTVHNAVWLDCKNNTVKQCMEYDKESELSPGEIVVRRYGFLPTASMVCRRELIEMEGFFGKVGVADYPLQLYCISQGKVHYIDKIMSVYRYMHDGSWQAEQVQQEDKHIWHCIRLINFLDCYDEYTQGRLKEYVISARQSFADSILASCSMDRIERYISICDDNTNVEYIRYRECFIRIKRLMEQITSEYFCEQNILDFVKNYKYVVIMGTGKYGGILAKQLKNNGIEYDGFVVSDDQQTEGTFMGKKVWKLNEIPFDKEKVGNLVGINPTIWYQIKKVLDDANCLNYCCPFII